MSVLTPHSSLPIQDQSSVHHHPMERMTQSFRPPVRLFSATHRTQELKATGPPFPHPGSTSPLGLWNLALDLNVFVRSARKFPLVTPCSADGTASCPYPTRRTATDAGRIRRIQRPPAGRSGRRSLAGNARPAIRPSRHREEILPASSALVAKKLRKTTSRP
jgi:hypothetical protein